MTDILLRCVKTCWAMDMPYTAGSVVEANQAEAERLQADAPGCFEIVKRLDGPPMDRSLAGRQVQNKEF